MPAETASGSGVQQLCDFLQTFSVSMLACGSQTLRVERSVRRIGLAYGLGVELAMFSRHVMLTVTDAASGESKTVVSSIPAGGPDFTKIRALNALG